MRCFQGLHRACNEGSRVLHHIDMDEDEAGLGGFGVQAMLKGSNQTDVVVLHALGGILELVIVKRIGACILHERHEAGSMDMG